MCCRWTRPSDAPIARPPRQPSPGNIETLLIRRFEEVTKCLPEEVTADLEQQLLIGAYLSAEYSFEAAALFNPSIVMRMNQDGAPANGLNFILSLRGIGERHVSSITFRTGSWSASSDFQVDDVYLGPLGFIRFMPFPRDPLERHQRGPDVRLDPQPLYDRRVFAFSQKPPSIIPLRAGFDQ